MSRRDLEHSLSIPGESEHASGCVRALNTEQNASSTFEAQPST
jgi:hypothetical protein